MTKLIFFSSNGLKDKRLLASIEYYVPYEAEEDFHSIGSNGDKYKN